MSLSDENEAQKRIKHKINLIKDRIVKMCEQVESLVNIIKYVNNSLENLL